jgi:hypothetical protein
VARSLRQGHFAVTLWVKVIKLETGGTLATATARVAPAELWTRARVSIEFWWLKKTGKIRVSQLDMDGITLTVTTVPSGFLGEQEDEEVWGTFEADYGFSLN